jgi:cell division protease FtsH
VDPRQFLRLLLAFFILIAILSLSFFIPIAILNLFGPKSAPPKPGVGPITLAELSYPEFVRYVGENRITKIQLFIEPMLQGRESKQPDVVYTTMVFPEHSAALEELLVKSEHTAVIFTQNPRDLDTATIEPSQSDQKPLRIKSLPAPEFLRRVGDRSFGEIKVFYKDLVLVTLKGAAFERIRYRVQIPATFENPSQDLLGRILADPTSRAALISIATTQELPVGPFPWRILLFAPAIGIGVWFLWRRYGATWFSAAGGPGRIYRQEDRDTKPTSEGTIPLDPLQNPIESGTPRVTFDDVGGQEEAVQDAQEIVEFLKNPEKFRKTGAKIPRGALLVGPPGTGKTLLGRAIAGEARVPFIYVSGSEFIEMYVGVGASRIRDLFKKARREAERSRGCILFIDEIDAVGSRRTDADSGGAKEHNQTLNQLLTEIDGFAPNSGIFVMGATNRMDMLDPALLRRFTRKIYMSLPDRKGREAILKIHMRGRNFDPSVTPKEFAKKTPLGFSGDDLQNAVNEAAIAAARAGRAVITWEDVQEGINRTMAGAARKSRILSQKEKVEVAYHESGHHYVRWFLHRVDPAHTDPPGTVTIIGRGMALGYSSSLPEEDRFLYDERYLKNQLTIAVAGRVAEEIFFGTRTSGAANDFEQATEIAIKMITKWIMGDREGLPPLALGRRGAGALFDQSKHREYSDETAKIIDDHAGALVEEAMEAARVILEMGREEVERLASALIEKETIEAEELEAIIFGVPVPAETETMMQERFAKLKNVAKWLAAPIVWPAKQLAALAKNSQRGGG